MSTIRTTLSHHIAMPLDANLVQKTANRVGHTTQTVTLENNAIVYLATCQCGCNQQFIALNNRHKYLDSKHRQRAYRNRLRTAISSDCRQCEHCHTPLPEKAHKSKKYCSTTCRQIAYRNRRKSAIETFARATNKSLDFANDVADTVGLSAIRIALELVQNGEFAAMS